MRLEGSSVAEPGLLDLPAELLTARAFQQINSGNEQDGLIELILRS